MFSALHVHQWDVQEGKTFLYAVLPLERINRQNFHSSEKHRVMQMSESFHCEDKLESGLIYVSKSKSFTDFSILNTSNKLQHDLRHAVSSLRH